MKDKFVTVDGCSIRYRDSGGAGTPVLLSHGIGGSIELWNKQFDGALSHLRLIAWDAPNHGLSDLSGKPEDFDTYATWALKLADALKLDRFVAAGNSMGAAVSLRAAQFAAQRVAGLVLVNPAAMGPEIFPVFRLFSLPLLGELMNKPGDKSVDLQIKSIVKDPSCVSPGQRAAIARNTAKKGGTAAFLATVRATMGLRGQKKAVWQKSHAILSAVTCPVLIIHGREDAVLPVMHSEAAARLTPKARLVVLENCGHTPQIEQPEVFNQALSDFMDELTHAAIPA